MTLESLRIKSGDTLTLEELETERERAIDFKDVVAVPGAQSAIPGTDAHSAAHKTNSNLHIGSESQKKGGTHSEMALDSAGAETQLFSGTKRPLDYSSSAESSNSHKRVGMLMRK